VASPPLMSPYLMIRNAIIAQELPPRAQLVENALAKKYNVSRTPIREALRRLETEGLVERYGSRMQVREYRPEEMLDLYEVRSFLEEAAAKTAALRHTDMDLMLIERAHQSMLDVKFEEASATQLAATNRTFHERVWAASHSAALLDLLDRILVHFIRYPGTTLSTPERWNQVLKEHEDLVAAIRDRDADRAARIASAHMEEAKNIRIEMYIDAQEMTSR
jgi:DNA-binding GntR family transcriptional regulator